MDDGTDSKAAARRQGQTADNREAKKKRGGMVGGEEGEDLMLKGDRGFACARARKRMAKHKHTRQ